MFYFLEFNFLLSHLCTLFSSKFDTLLCTQNEVLRREHTTPHPPHTHIHDPTPIKQKAIHISTLSPIYLYVLHCPVSTFRILIILLLPFAFLIHFVSFPLVLSTCQILTETPRSFYFFPTGILVNLTWLSTSLIPHAQRLGLSSFSVLFPLHQWREKGYNLLKREEREEKDLIFVKFLKN